MRVLGVVVAIIVLTSCAGDGASPGATTAVSTVAEVTTTASPRASSTTTTTSTSPTTTTTSTSTTSTSTSTTSTSTTTTSTSVASTTTAPSIEAGRTSLELSVGDEQRTALVVVPDELTVPAPLLLVFHGLTGTSLQAEVQSDFTDLAVANGFVVVYPQAAGAIAAWRASTLQGTADVRYVDRIVETLSEALRIDQERIFAAGISNGGGMVDRLACDRSTVFAAVAPVAAAHPPSACSPERPVAIIAFHAVDDSVVSYDGFGPLLPPIEQWAAGKAASNGCGLDPVIDGVAPGVDRLTWGTCTEPVVLYRSIDGGHHWPGPDSEPASAAAGIDGSLLIWSFFEQHPLVSAATS